MILSFLNQKGGVGKSTLSTNAVDYLHPQGRKTLLIDLKSVVLVSRIIVNTDISRSIRAHVADHGIPMLEATVANRAPFAEALTMDKTIFEWAPRSPAAWEFSTVMEEIGAFYEQEELTQTVGAAAADS